MKYYFDVAAIIVSGLLAVIISSAAWSDEFGDRQQAARKVSGQLLQQLGGALKNELDKQGPEGAISVCRDVAPKIAGELSREHGWQVTRVSDNVRNPMLGMPDAWELKVLKDFRVRAGNGEKYPDMVFSEVVEEAGKAYFRFMKPIGTRPMCLSCHGSREQIPPAVQAKLNSDYPNDKAVGYKAGDLRGAVSIKQPMDIPLQHNSGVRQ